MTAPAVLPVKPDAVTDVEPLDGSAQIGLRQFDHEVIMIVHQDRSVQPQGEAADQLVQQFAIVLQVPVLPENGAAFVAPAGDD